MLLIPAVLLPLAAGCGEDRDAGGDPSPSPEPAAVEVVGTDFALDPAEARVGRPGAIRVRFVNEGDTDHALAVQGPTGAIATPAVRPGERATLRADLPRGVYKWSCPLRDHERRGMTGRLRVAE